MKLRTSSRPTSGSPAYTLFSWRPSARVATADLAASVRALSVMVSARLPIVDALDAVAAQSASVPLREVWSDAARRVRRGHPFSDALAAHQEVLGSSIVQLGRVGEASGTLDAALDRAADDVERAHALRRKVRLALIYPALVLGVAVGAVAFLLVVVVPTFAELFADFDAPLPAPTRIVVSASEFLRGHLVTIIIGLLVAAAVLRAAWSSAGGRALWDRMRLVTPVLGPLVRQAESARAARTLAILTESGVPLVDAIAAAAAGASNSIVARALSDAGRRVERGSPLALPLRRAEVFPPLLVEMIAVGEATGQLSDVLQKTAQHLNAEVEASVEALTAVIEPALIVVLGVLVGGILIAIYLPMFDLVTVLE